MRSFWVMLFASAMLLAVPGVGMTRAENTTKFNDHVAVPTGNGAHGFQGQNAMAAGQQAKPLDAAEVERRKQLSDETAKLLQSATELKAAVDKSNKNQMSLEVIRKADDVEKLAHDLKLMMRS